MGCVFNYAASLVMREAQARSQGEGLRAILYLRSAGGQWRDWVQSCNLGDAERKHRGHDERRR